MIKQIVFAYPNGEQIVWDLEKKHNVDFPIRPMDLTFNNDVMRKVMVLPSPNSAGNSVIKKIKELLFAPVYKTDFNDLHIKFMKIGVFDKDGNPCTVILENLPISPQHDSSHKDGLRFKFSGFISEKNNPTTHIAFIYNNYHLVFDENGHYADGQVSHEKDDIIAIQRAILLMMTKTVKNNTGEAVITPDFSARFNQSCMNILNSLGMSKWLSYLPPVKRNLPHSMTYRLIPTYMDYLGIKISQGVVDKQVDSKINYNMLFPVVCRLMCENGVNKMSETLFDGFVEWFETNIYQNDNNDNDNEYYIWENIFQPCLSSNHPAELVQFMAKTESYNSFFTQNELDLNLFKKNADFIASVLVESVDMNLSLKQRYAILRMFSLIESDYDYMEFLNDGHISKFGASQPTFKAPDEMNHFFNLCAAYAKLFFQYGDMVVSRPVNYTSQFILDNKVQATADELREVVEVVQCLMRASNIYTNNFPSCKEELIVKHLQHLINLKATLEYTKESRDVIDNRIANTIPAFITKYKKISYELNDFKEVFNVIKKISYFSCTKSFFIVDANSVIPSNIFGMRAHAEMLDLFNQIPNVQLFMFGLDYQHYLNSEDIHPNCVFIVGELPNDTYVINNLTVSVANNTGKVVRYVHNLKKLYYHT